MCVNTERPDFEIFNPFIKNLLHETYEVMLLITSPCLTFKVSSSRDDKEENCPITLRIESSIISIDSNITDNIVRKIINV